MKKIRVRINDPQNYCLGCASCVSIAQDVFEIDENGHSKIKKDINGIVDVSANGREATITEENLINSVKELVEISICPFGLIEIVKEN